MIEQGTIWQGILPVFLIFAIGTLLRSRQLLPTGGDQTLIWLVLNLFMPCLILDNVLGNPALKEGGIVLWSITLGFGFVAAATVLAYLIAPLAGLSQGHGRRTFGVSAGLQNYGYLAIPVLVAVFGSRANLGVLFLHNLGVELALWSVGIMLLAGGEKEGLKTLVNGPLVAVVLGLSLNAADLGQSLPASVRQTMRILSACAIPIGILLCGLTLGDALKGWRPSLRVGAFAIATRLLLAPALMIATVMLLPVPEMLARVVVVQAAMPAGIFPIVMARHYGGHPGTAVQVVLSTTLVSLITIPPLLAYAIRLLDL